MLATNNMKRGSTTWSLYAGFPRESRTNYQNCIVYNFRTPLLPHRTFTFNDANPPRASLLGLALLCVRLAGLLLALAPLNLIKFPVNLGAILVLQSKIDINVAERWH